MKQKVLIITLTILTFLGCSENSENSLTDKNTDVFNFERIDFKDFLDNIPTIALPLTIRCGFETTLYENDFNNKYRSFIPKDFEAVGKLKTDKNLNLILYASVGDILYPYLFSFDTDGNKIDSVYLHLSTCAGDPNLELSTWSVIDNDLTIIMTDTAQFFNYSETDNDYTRILDSTIITKRIVQIDNLGRFIKTSEEKEVISESDSLKSIKIFQTFSENFLPTRKPNSRVAMLPEVPDTVLQALRVVKKSHPKEFEKYLTLIFIKLYSAHLECCHQSYEIRKLPLSGNLDKNRDPLIYEFNILANKYVEGKPIEFISSSIGYDYVKSNPHLLGFDLIKKQVEIIEQFHKNIEQGK
jgi:hypothetical protein